MSAIPRIMPSHRMLLAHHFAGDSLSRFDDGKWKHPWFTTPSWNTKGKQWVATVEPGYVDALDTTGHGALLTPVYSATVAEQEDIGNPWEINPLTGKQFFSDPIFAGQSQTVSEKQVDLPLYLEPLIPLDLYGIGWDGDPNVSVPAFFRSRGVAPAPAQPDPTADPSLVAAPTPPANLRLLRACDLWLKQPRAGLTSSVALSDGTVTGQSNVTQTLSILTPGDQQLQILTGQFAPFTQPPFDPLQDDYTEVTFDQLLVSTVYLLSPPKTPIGSQPDATWQSFVKHNLFWNLSWAQPAFRGQVLNPDASNLGFLAEGVASNVINFLSASLNDATQTALNNILANSLAGTFWTVTGGGHTSDTSILQQQAAAKLGPNRRKNAVAVLKFKQQQKQQQRLDPDFPYVAIRAPLTLLNAA